MLLFHGRHNHLTDLSFLEHFQALQNPHLRIPSSGSLPWVLRLKPVWSSRGTRVSPSTLLSDLSQGLLEGGTLSPHLPKGFEDSFSHSLAIPITCTPVISTYPPAQVDLSDFHFHVENPFTLLASWVHDHSFLFSYPLSLPCLKLCYNLKL